MKFSARNSFPGTVKEVIKGPVSTEVTITIAPGIDVVSVISTRSAEGLGLAQGRKAYAMVKASSVMVAVD
jgi:molybdopterin-binding protein